jgi:2-isopropylmalate synthase
MRVSAIMEKAGLSCKERKIFLSRIEEKKKQGFDFDEATASLEILARKSRRDYCPLFQVLEFEVTVGNKRSEHSSEAIVEVKIGNEERKEVSGGNGPVNALDKAIRKALSDSYPCVNSIFLEDYRVSVLDGKNGTASVVRVLISFSDGREHWITVGCSANIIVASLQALRDGLEYKIF